MDIFIEHWAELLLALIAFLDIVVSLTPSPKDDKFLGYFRVIVNAFAGKRKKKA